MPRHDGVERHRVIRDIFTRGVIVFMSSSSENTSLQASSPVYKNGVPYYQHRTLFGWLDDQHASEARASFREDTLENHLLVAAAAKAAAQSQPAFVPASPLSELEESPLLEAIRARPETAFVAAGMKWQFAQVNLNEVLTFQPVIRVDKLDDRVPAGPLSQEQLFELCFPALPGELICAEELALDLTEGGYLLHTLNPNIRLSPWHKVGSPMLVPQQALLSAGLPFHPDVPPVSAAMLPFVLTKNPGYLQVVQYQDRYFIRDGYHRAAAFLRRNIAVVPCIHLEVQDPQQVGHLQPGMFRPEILFGEHPPRLRDFWDDAVSCDSFYPAKRRVFLVEMREVQVPR